MATISLLLLITFEDIQAHYYSAESWRIAAVQVETLDMEGDTLHWAVNYIVRANYKQANYRRGMELVKKHLDPHLEDMPSNLRWDVVGLKALLAKNLGEFALADSLYRKVIGSTTSRGILYRAHLNYADLNRLEGRQDRRLEHLEAARGLAQTSRERDRVLRVLCRYYFSVELNYLRARQMLIEHTDADSIENPETKAGYMLLMAQYNEAAEEYEAAAHYYQRALAEAKSAGFVAFMYDASDGAARADALGTKKSASQHQFQLFITIVVALIGAGYLINYYTNRRIDARQ